jgi:peroxiredoxin Q/BCP
MRSKKASTKKKGIKRAVKKMVKKATKKIKKTAKKVAKRSASKKVPPKTKKIVKKAIVSKKKERAGASYAPRVGSLAPNFSLPSTAGGSIAPADFRGRRIVLYFYPKDMTSGCTTEAHEFSAIAKKFAAKRVFVFGVSPDTIDSHKAFIKKEGITYPLLADVGHNVADAYGVWVEKSMYGQKYMGIERSTFVIGRDGRIEHIYRKVSPEGHAVCVLEDLGK